MVAAVNAEHVVLVLILLGTSLVSVFYYLKLPVAMYMREPRNEPSQEASSSEFVVLALCAAAVLYFGFFPQSDPLGSGLQALDLAGRAADFLQ